MGTEGEPGRSIFAAAEAERRRVDAGEGREISVISPIQWLEYHCEELLHFILGDDAYREREDSVAETPKRWAAWMHEMFFADGDLNTDTVFEAVRSDQMVAVSGITTWSLCEHHLLPFSTTMAVGYTTHDKIIGASKLVRIAKEAARGLQVQERLVHQTADGVGKVLGHDNVAVIADGLHLCMAMRGVKEAATLHTSVMRGSFGKVETRSEFMNLIAR